MIGWVEDPDTYPIQPKPHSLEFLREVAHLRPRTNVIAAATRVRHTLAQAIHRFFDENGFFWLNTPIITASDAEGAGALFRVSTLDLANLPRTPQGEVDFAQISCRTSDAKLGASNISAAKKARRMLSLRSGIGCRQSRGSASSPMPAVLSRTARASATVAVRQ